MRARYYDAVTARFLSRDPIWPEIHDPSQINPYQYAKGSPLSYIDPIGAKLPVGSIPGEIGGEVINQILGEGLPSKSWLGLLISLVKGQSTGYKQLDPEWPNGAPQFVKERIYEQFVAGELSSDLRPWEREYIREISRQRITQDLDKIFREKREEQKALRKKILAEEKERKFWEAFAKIKPIPVPPPEVVGQRRTVEKHYQRIVVSDPPSRSWEEIIEELKEERIAKIKKQIEYLNSVLYSAAGYDTRRSLGKRGQEEFKDEMWKLVDEVRKLTGRNVGLYELID